MLDTTLLLKLTRTCMRIDLVIKIIKLEISSKFEPILIRADKEIFKVLKLKFY